MKSIPTQWIFWTFLSMVTIPAAFATLNAGTYYSGSGGLLDNCAVTNCDYTTTKCPNGQYLSGCGGSTPTSAGTCLPCNNLPALNASYTSNGLSTGVATGCQWACNTGYSKDVGYTGLCIASECPVTVSNIEYINGNFQFCTYQCAAGYFGATVGGAKGPVSCTPCSPGSYTATANSAFACTLCEAGKVNNIDHATGCTTCAKDTYTLSTDTGKIACLACTDVSPACSVGQWRTGCGSIGAGTCATCSNSAKI